VVNGGGELRAGAASFSGSATDLNGLVQMLAGM